MDNIFLFFIFRNCPKKGVKGDAIYFVNSPSVYEEDLAEETAEKKIKNKIKKKIKKKSKNQKKILKKNLTSFFLNFSKLPPKKDAQGNAVYILSALNVFLKRMKHKRLLKVHPLNVLRGCFFFFFQLSVEG